MDCCNRHDGPRAFACPGQRGWVDGAHRYGSRTRWEGPGHPRPRRHYAQGGHAFGLRATKLPIGRWPALVEQWLQTIGVLQMARSATVTGTRAALIAGSRPPIRPMASAQMIPTIAIGAVTAR
jgi:hypothetical protein